MKVGDRYATTTPLDNAPESLNTLSGCLHPGVPPADVTDWARVAQIGGEIYRREGKIHG